MKFFLWQNTNETIIILIGSIFHRTETLIHKHTNTTTLLLTYSYSNYMHVKEQHLFIFLFVCFVFSRLSLYIFFLRNFVFIFIWQIHFTSRSFHKSFQQKVQIERETHSFQTLPSNQSPSLHTLYLQTTHTHKTFYIG